MFSIIFLIETDPIFIQVIPNSILLSTSQPNIEANNKEKLQKAVVNVAALSD